MELEVKNKGFTIIEMLVALAIFGLVVFSLTAIAGSIIRGQRKAFALQDIQETSRFISESISKEIRMSYINSADSGGSSVTSLDITAIKTTGNEDVDYWFDNANGRLYRNLDLISPDDIEVTGGFYIRKNAFPAWSAVTIIMKIKSKGDKPEEQAEVYLQGTIVPRTF